MTRVPAAVRADLDAQLAWLLGPAGMAHLDRAGVSRVSRSIDAIARRLQRVDSNPGKDLRKLEGVAPLARRFDALVAAAGELNPALRGVQLLLEDYRVSVFAPELGVPSRVAADDIESALALLEAGP
jgi:ATP-dependent helicase HrpA